MRFKKKIFVILIFTLLLNLAVSSKKKYDYDEDDFKPNKKPKNEKDYD